MGIFIIASIVVLYVGRELIMHFENKESAEVADEYEDHLGI